MTAYLLPALGWLFLLSMILRDASEYERTHPTREWRNKLDERNSLQSLFPINRS